MFISSMKIISCSLPPSGKYSKPYLERFLLLTLASISSYTFCAFVCPEKFIIIWEFFLSLNNFYKQSFTVIVLAVPVGPINKTCTSLSIKIYSILLEQIVSAVGIINSWNFLSFGIFLG
jgi:hypothetical protein